MLNAPTGTYHCLNGAGTGKFHPYSHHGERNEWLSFSWAESTSLFCCISLRPSSDPLTEEERGKGCVYLAVDECLCLTLRITERWYVWKFLFRSYPSYFIILLCLVRLEYYFIHVPLWHWPYTLWISCLRSKICCCIRVAVVVLNSLLSVLLFLRCRRITLPDLIANVLPC